MNSFWFLIIASAISACSLFAEPPKEAETTSGATGIADFGEKTFAKYALDNAKLFEGLEKMIIDSPEYGPGVGIDGLTSPLATVFVSVDLAKARTEVKIFKVEIRQKIMLREQSNLSSPFLFSVSVGTRTSITTTFHNRGFYYANPITAEILLVADYESRKVMEGDGGKTIVKRGEYAKNSIDGKIVIDKEHYNKLKALAAGHNPDKNMVRDEEPLAWIEVVPALLVPAKLETEEHPTFRVAFGKCPKLQLYKKYSLNARETTVESLIGEFSDAELWNGLRKHFISL